MKHARADYDRFQDPAGLIPEDEPVFLLRGQDVLAPAILRAYADAAAKLGLWDIVVRTNAHAILMDRWQETRARKRPDLSLSAEPVTATEGC